MTPERKSYYLCWYYHYYNYALSSRSVVHICTHPEDRRAVTSSLFLAVAPRSLSSPRLLERNHQPISFFFPLSVSMKEKEEPKSWTSTKHLSVLLHHGKRIAGFCLWSSRLHVNSKLKFSLYFLPPLPPPLIQISRNFASSSFPNWGIRTVYWRWQPCKLARWESVVRFYHARLWLHPGEKNNCSRQKREKCYFGVEKMYEGKYLMSALNIHNKLVSANKIKMGNSYCVFHVRNFCIIKTKCSTMRGLPFKNILDELSLDLIHLAVAFAHVVLD